MNAYPKLLHLLLVLSFLSTGHAQVVDRNGNGLSDIYELKFPGLPGASADSDGDGQSNAAESRSGTNPWDSASIFEVEDVEQQGANALARFQSLAGKLYQMQSSDTLAGSSWSNEGPPYMGNDTELECLCPFTGQRIFLRLLVADIDSDGDSISDWEELQVGLNPNAADTDGDSVNDLAFLDAQLNQPDTVDVVALDANATESGTTTARFQIARRGGLEARTVYFALSGSASLGADYTISNPSSVTIPFGANSAEVTVTALADASNESSESVILTIVPDAGYALGSAASASVFIHDASLPGGTGLLGNYYDNSSNTYNASDPYVSGSNFNPSDWKASRTEEVNFNWGTGIPHPSLVDADYHSIVWTGSVEPQFTEAYTFYHTANNGAKLWINGVLATNAWSNTAEQTSAPMNLVAGRRYSVVFEYHDETGSSVAQLRWSSASQAKQIIPAARLHPYRDDKPPFFTSEGLVVAVTGQPFLHSLKAKYNPTSFAISGLPAGLSLDASSGQITGAVADLPNGTPLKFYFMTRMASNAAGTSQTPFTLVVVNTDGVLERQKWSGISGSSLAGLPFHTVPTSSSEISPLQAPANDGDNFAERVSGWLVAPYSGNYSFFLTSGDENAELWISSTDDPARVLKRAWIMNAAPNGAWSTVASQRSLPMKLKAGQKYYLETRRKESTGNDQLSVGWLKPGETGSAPSEVIPSYALSKYLPPAATEVGTIYTANMSPQAGAVTLGSGSAVLTMNPQETAATLTFTFANLTGPISSMHLHDGGHGGAVIFDIDDEEPDAAGVRHWTFVPTGQLTVADIVQAIKTGQCYINLHTNAYPNGEIKGFFKLANGSRTFTPPDNPPALSTNPITNGEAVRFLQQASFGVRGDDDDNNGQWDEIEKVKNVGYAAWITEQINATLTPQTFIQPEVTQHYLNFPRDTSTGSQPQASNEIWRFWWKTMCHKPEGTKHKDQLRQRVAFALSEILVISEEAGGLDERASAVLKYHDLLAANAFGNFRTLLNDMTLSAPMGRYLDMLNNSQPNPNENFAREIMQLFSISLRRLHPDGTLVFGHDGLPVSTYDQDEIVGLAHVFTGWQLGDAPLPPALDSNDAHKQYLVPMKYTDSRHSNLEKFFLDNTIIPEKAKQLDLSGDGQTNGQDDLQAALDVLFLHPSTGPFICRQLIQRLVTSNPSPGYLYRVTRAFEDDGTGTRGNLGAVVRAILLDYEARETVPAAQPGFGHLKEPILKVTQVIRALHGYSLSEGKSMPWYVANPSYDPANALATQPKFLPVVPPLPSPGWDIGATHQGGSSNGTLSQTPMKSPTVFNFFEPDYKFAPGYDTNGNVIIGFTGAAGLVGPEFQIASETTLVKAANYFYDLGRGAAGGVGNSTNHDNYDPLNPASIADVYATSATPGTGTYTINSAPFNGMHVNYSTLLVGADTVLDKPRAETESADIKLDITVEKALGMSALVDRLSLLLTADQTPSAVKTIILNYLNTLPSATDADKIYRVWDAIRLFTLSPEFCVQR